MRLGELGRLYTAIGGNACKAMGGTVTFQYSMFGPGGGTVDCVVPDQPAANINVSPTISPRITVNPTIQSQISPQISPVFQQAFQPSNSPMSAGTTQNMPTAQTAAPAAPAPQYQAPAPAAPTAAPDNSAALLDQQRQMYEAYINKLTAPGGVPTSSLPSPAPVAPPMPAYQSAPLPIQSSAPQPFDTSAPPMTGDTTGTLPQFGLSTSGQTAAAAFSAQNPPPVVSVPATKKSNLPLIFALLAGAGILFVSTSQHKGKRHAT